MRFSILGIDYEVGEEKIDIKDIINDPDRTIKSTGIPYVFSSSKSSEDLAYLCSKRLITKYNVDPDILIYVSQSNRNILPGSGILLHDMLGLKRSCEVYDLNSACSGFAQALMIALRFINSVENILIVCSEKYRTKLLKDDRSTNSVFSDASSAILINNQPLLKLLKTSFFGAGNLLKLLYQPYDSDNKTFLQMNGRDVWNFTRNDVLQQLENITNDTLEQGYKPDKILIHQASKVVVDGIERLYSHGHLIEKNYHIYGNTVSSTIPILIKTNKIDINNLNSIIAGFGVGLMSCMLSVVKNK